MAQFADLVQSAADWLFVPVLVIVLFGTGLFLTIRLGFVQITRFGEAMRAFLGGRAATAGGVLTPFQAFMTALGTTIGTGNIAGVAAGIVSGGPGVLFWIWCYGFFATAITTPEIHRGMPTSVCATRAIEFVCVNGVVVSAATPATTAYVIASARDFNPSRR